MNPYTTIAYIIGIVYIISCIIILIKEIPSIVAYILCYKKHNCKKDDCVLRKYCPRAGISDREWELLMKKLDELGD